MALAEETPILAFDIGGTRIKAGIVHGAVVSKPYIEELDGAVSTEKLLELLVRLHKYLTKETEVQAVAISMKGIIDPGTGTVLDVNETWSDLIGRPFASELAQTLGLPTCIENDARMYTVGEMLYGAGTQADNLLCLTLGTGVGSGVALQRRVLRGPRGVSGILGGHITVQSDGPLCTCGNLGCLEALIGTTALARKATQLALAQNGQALAERQLTPHALFTAAAAGDKLALQVVEYFSRNLAAGLVSLIHAHDPELVILGGGIAAAAAQFLPAVQTYIDTHAWTIPRGRVRVKTAALGNHAALLGIAALARGLDVLL